MKLKLLLLTISLSFFFSITSVAQYPTIGLIYNSSEASEGYLLFSPEHNTSVYLVDNCGEKINEWTFTEKPGLTCYLLENGNLLRPGRDSLELRDWDNNLLWSYAMDSNGIKQHHDIEPLPNGNILCIVSEIFTEEEIVALGRDTSMLQGNLKLDKIVELEPVGTNDANIVWEWKFSDHLIQDFDSTKPNYGIVADNSGLINLNFENGQYTDYTHLNGVDYNQDLDQVLVSCRHLSEIYIIDHSTTNTEVSGHTGGNSNMGGDIIYRWGNPRVYNQGDESDQLLFKQHDSKWVENDYLDNGKISVFNNGGDGTNTYSSIVLILPEIDNGEYVKTENVFLPSNFDWSWNGDVFGEVVNDGLKSGAHSLPNGNFIFCEYSNCRVTEITKEGIIVWSYVCPFGADILSQYTPASYLTNPIFRGEKYPPDYAGFDGKDLTPQGILENTNIISEACVSVNIESINFEDKPMILKNIISNSQIEFTSIINADLIRVVGIDGKIHLTKSNFEGQFLNINLNKGIYLVQLINGKTIKTEKIIVQ